MADSQHPNTLSLRYRLHALMVVLGPGLAACAWVQVGSWPAFCHGVAATVLALSGLAADRAPRPVPAAEPRPEAPASRRAA